MHRAAKGSELPPPALLHIAPHGIGVHTASHLQASIQTAPTLQAGDLLELFWGNRYVAAHLLRAGEPGTSIALAVPRQMLYPGLNTLHYRLLQPGQHPRRSAPLQVAVKLNCPGGYVTTPENPHLTPLRLPGRLLRQGLDLSRCGQGVPFNIAPYRHMAEGDAITLRWADLRIDLAPLPSDGIGCPIQGLIPTQVLLEAGNDEHLDASYCILDKVGNCSQWAPAVRLRVFGQGPRRHFYAYS